jgi:hypothetical protein
VLPIDELVLEPVLPAKGVIIVVRIDEDLLEAELDGLATCTDLFTGGEYLVAELVDRDVLGLEKVVDGLDVIAGGGDEGLDTDAGLLGDLEGAGLLARGAGLDAGGGLGRDAAAGRLGARAGAGGGDGGREGARDAAGGGEGRAAGCGVLALDSGLAEGDAFGEGRSRP